MTDPPPPKATLDDYIAALYGLGIIFLTLDLARWLT